jgi:tryptophanyl-tRNA synthetase
MLNLSGESKMSKRTLSSSFTLDEDPASASKKVMSAFTGGRATVEEQRRIGGQADICPVYDLYKFHFALNDEHVKRVYDECVGGIRMCGECKAEVAGLIRKYLEKHQKKRKSLMKDAQELLDKSRQYLASTGN